MNRDDLTQNKTHRASVALMLLIALAVAKPILAKDACACRMPDGETLFQMCPCPSDLDEFSRVRNTFADTIADSSSTSTGEELHCPLAGRCQEGYQQLAGVCVDQQRILLKGIEAMGLLAEAAFNSGVCGAPVVVLVEACDTEIKEKDDDTLGFSNGAVVELPSLSSGHSGLTTAVVMFNAGFGWKIAFDAKQVYSAEIVRKPANCSSPTMYTIQNAVDGEILTINGESFLAQTQCTGWYESQLVTFLEGSALGACSQATLLNYNREETCEVWCM